MVCSGYLPLFGVMAICRGQYDARFKWKYILKEHVIYEGTVRLDIYESAEDVETMSKPTLVETTSGGVAEQQERAWSSTPEEMRNVGYALSAGLLYAAQMVAVLAFYLDLPLPHSLCYSQFGARDESEEEFRNWVARLNSNVLHLCASQGLQPPLLRPRTTLRNLALLVQHRGNIRFGPVDMSHDLWASLEESLGPELLPSDADSDDNDDWEDVTDTSEAASPVQWRPSSPPPPPSSSLLSSAAALVTNFWRPK